MIDVKEPSSLDAVWFMCSIKSSAWLGLDRSWHQVVRMTPFTCTTYRCAT